MPFKFIQIFTCVSPTVGQVFRSLYQYVASNFDNNVLKDLSKKERNWVINTAPRCTVVDGLLMYSDEFMNNPSHLRIFVPSDTQLQQRLLQAYHHDSPMSMHRGRDATYLSLSQDFYWRNLAKHVRNWVRRCPQCIRFKSTQPAHRPMHVRVYQHPFHTLAVGYVRELSQSLHGNKWILTAVCNTCP